MEIKLKKMDDISTLFNLIKGINDEAYLRINTDGIILEAMDKSNIMLVKIKMNKEFFDTYNVENNNQFFVDFNIMSRIMNSMKKGFELNELDSELEFVGDKITRKMKKMPDDTVGKDITAEYTHSFIIQTTEFFDKIKTASELGETIKLEFQDILKIYNKNKFEDIVLDLETETEGSGFDKTFLSAEFLMRLEILKKLTDKIKINLDTDAPFYLVLTQPTYTVEAWLATKVDQEDN